MASSVGGIILVVSEYHKITLAISKCYNALHCCKGWEIFFTETDCYQQVCWASHIKALPTHVYAYS